MGAGSIIWDMPHRDDCPEGCCTKEDPGKYVVEDNETIFTPKGDELLDLFYSNDCKDQKCRENIKSDGQNEAIARRRTTQEETNGSELPSENPNLPSLTEEEKEFVFEEPCPSLETVKEEMEESVRGDIGFYDRLDRMRNRWANSEKVSLLMDGKNFEAGFTTEKEGELVEDRSKGECSLATCVGFTFDRNLMVARYLFEEEANLKKYWENSTHRLQLYQCVKAPDWAYTNIPTMAVRMDVAKALHDMGSARTVRGLAARTSHGKTQVHRALKYFEEEKAVIKDGNWRDRNLGEFISQYDGQARIEPVTSVEISELAD